MFKWRIVTSDVSQRSALGLFNTYINDVDSKTECIIKRFANVTKLSGAVDSLVERDAMQRSLNSLDEQASVNITKFTRLSERS